MAEVTNLSLKLLGKLIHSVPLLMKGILIKQPFSYCYAACITAVCRIFLFSGLATNSHLMFGSLEAFEHHTKHTNKLTAKAHDPIPALQHH